MNPHDHLTAAQFEAWLRQDPKAPLDDWAAHLADCPDCRADLAVLAIERAKERDLARDLEASHAGDPRMGNGGDTRTSIPVLTRRTGRGVRSRESGLNQVVADLQPIPRRRRRLAKTVHQRRYTSNVGLAAAAAVLIVVTLGLLLAPPAAQDVAPPVGSGSDTEPVAPVADDRDSAPSPATPVAPPPGTDEEPLFPDEGDGDPFAHDGESPASDPDASDGDRPSPPPRWIPPEQVQPPDPALPDPPPGRILPPGWDTPPAPDETVDTSPECDPDAPPVEQPTPVVPEEAVEQPDPERTQETTPFPETEEESPSPVARPFRGMVTVMAVQGTAYFGADEAAAVESEERVVEGQTLPAQGVLHLRSTRSTVLLSMQDQSREIGQVLLRGGYVGWSSQGIALHDTEAMVTRAEADADDQSLVVTHSLPEGSLQFSLAVPDTRVVCVDAHRDHPGIVVLRGRVQTTHEGGEITVLPGEAFSRGEIDLVNSSANQVIPGWLPRAFGTDEQDALLAFNEWRITPDHRCTAEVVFGTTRAPCSHRPDHWWARSYLPVNRGGGGHNGNGEDDDDSEGENGDEEQDDEHACPNDETRPDAQTGIIVLQGPADAPLVITRRTVLELEVHRRVNPPPRLFCELHFEGIEEPLVVPLPVRGEPGACRGWQMLHLDMAPFLSREYPGGHVTRLMIRTESRPAHQISVRWIRALQMQ